jgi:hypothetical protein
MLWLLCIRRGIRSCRLADIQRLAARALNLFARQLGFSF